MFCREHGKERERKLRRHEASNTPIETVARAALIVLFSITGRAAAGGGRAGRGGGALTGLSAVSLESFC